MCSIEVDHLRRNVASRGMLESLCRILMKYEVPCLLAQSFNDVNNVIIVNLLIVIDDEIWSIYSWAVGKNNTTYLVAASYLTDIIERKEVC